MISRRTKDALAAKKAQGVKLGGLNAKGIANREEAYLRGLVKGVARARTGRPLMASFVLCGCPIVVKTAIPTSGAARMADSAIRFWDLMALSRDQKKLFPHFGEAGTAIFAVEEVEDGGHDRTPLFDHHHAIICSGCKT
jgi:hypothetical protein